jgi:bacillithiol system protein YtxJ
MDPLQILDESALESVLAAPSLLLFKHSLTCPVSLHAFARYRAFLAKHPETPTAWIDVIGQRPLSLAVAERTGVKHESPQALLFEKGVVVWNASHEAIDPEALAAALGLGDSA